MNEMTETKLRISRALKDKEPVYLDFTNETGKWLWAVALVSDPEFWLTAFSEKKQATAYCEKHGLTIQAETNRPLEDTR